MGILFRLATFGTSPRRTVARNDVTLRPVQEHHALSDACNWCLFANLVCRSTGIRWRPRAATSSKEATQSLAPLLLGCQGQGPLTVF